jgi:hypothetical protein
MLMVPEWQRQLLNCSLSDSDELPYLSIKKLKEFCYGVYNQCVVYLSRSNG